MAASDHLSGAQFYHGTLAKLRAGDMITPGHTPNFASKPEKHVYMTGSPEGAHQWAEDVAAMPHPVGSPSRPLVYKVEPTGPYHRDPKGEIPGESGDHRSKSPLRVVKNKVNMRDL